MVSPRRRSEDEEEGYPSRSELLRKAFRLGFAVGYRGHREGIGWVRKSRSEMAEAARSLEISDDVERYYLRGKEIGRRRRMQKLAMGEAISAVVEQLPAEMESFEMRMFGPEELKEFSSLPGAVDPPAAMQAPRARRLPLFLRLSRLFRPF